MTFFNREDAALARAVREKYVLEEQLKEMRRRYDELKEKLRAACMDTFEFEEDEHGHQFKVCIRCSVPVEDDNGEDTELHDPSCYFFVPDEKPLPTSIPNPSAEILTRVLEEGSVSLAVRKAFNNGEEATVEQLIELVNEAAERDRALDKLLAAVKHRIVP